MGELPVQRHWPLLCAVALVAVSIGGCGGGGGGGDGGSTSTPPTQSTTGLVPEPLARGAVLAADATTLRVMRPGATWRYRGLDNPFENPATGTKYTNVVTQVAAATGVNEQSTNLYFGGDSSSNIQVGAGSVSAPDQIQVDPSIAPVPFIDLQLRSPVVQNDQYTTFEHHYADVGEDFDGDGTNEALDIAVWVRVVGTETIDLPNRRGVQAIRVDTTLDERMTYSHTGRASDVYEVVRRQWYAQGIGIVKTELEQPGANMPTARHVTTELLDTWDGQTQGVGYLPVQAAVASSGESAGISLPEALDAVAFDDHAVVMTNIPNAVPAEGFTLSSFDLRGNVSSSTNQHLSAVAPQGLYAPRLLRIGSELRAVGMTNLDGFAMVGFDAHGVTRTLPLTLLLPPAAYYASPSIEAAASGNRFWLLWGSPVYDGTNNVIGQEIKLQSFDASGAPAAAAVVLDTLASANALHSLRLVASSDRVFASWDVQGISGYQAYAIADTTSGTVLSSQRLLPTAVTTLDPWYYDLQPLALGPGLVMTFESNTIAGALAGVQLDSSGNVIRSSAGSLGNEIISPAWMLPAFGHVTTAAGLGKGFAAVSGRTSLWPDDANTTTAAEQFIELTPGNGPLASGGNLKLLAQVPNFYVSFMLPYADRVLLIGTGLGGTPSSGTLQLTAVWRQPQ